MTLALDAEAAQGLTLGPRIEEEEDARVNVEGDWDPRLASLDSQLPLSDYGFRAAGDVDQESASVTGLESSRPVGVSGKAAGSVAAAARGAQWYDHFGLLGVTGGLDICHGGRVAAAAGVS